jgi:translation initiation factor 4E
MADGDTTGLHPLQHGASILVLLNISSSMSLHWRVMGMKIGGSILLHALFSLHWSVCGRCYRRCTRLRRKYDGKLRSLHDSKHLTIFLLFLIFIEWVLWERVGGVQNSSDWNAHMNELCSFATIEDFWRYFNNIPKPSQVFFDGDTKKRVGPKAKQIVEYNLFKRGIEPEWGDPQNASGGSFFIRQSLDMNTLDMFWQNLVMGLVGETMENDADDSGDKSGKNCICGARIVDKGRNVPIFRVELWINTREADKKDKIKTKLVECLIDGLGTLRKGVPKFEWKDHST